MAKPSILPRWGDTAAPADVVAPNSSKQGSGWSNGELPPHTYFNWWQNLVYQWIQWLNGLLDTANAWSARQSFNGGCTVPASTPASSDAARRSEVDAADALLMPLAGGMFTGSPSYAADPGGENVLARKSYIDGKIFGRTNLPAVGQQLSASCGDFSNGGSGFVDVPNLTVTLTTSGRPIVVALQPSGVAPAAGLQSSHVKSTSYARFRFLRDGASISDCNGPGASGSSEAVIATPSSFHALDVPGAGTYTYKFQVDPGTVAIRVYEAKLIAYEL